MNQIIGYIVMGMGVTFLFLGALGVFRFPDVYNRLQAGTKCTTLGAFLSIIGTGIIEPTWFLKCLTIAIFVLFTNPISAHALARASYKSGVKLWDKSVVDKCKEFEECINVEEEDK